MAGARLVGVAFVVAVILAVVGTGTASSPSAAGMENGRLGSVVALDARTGSEVWTARPAGDEGWFRASPGDDVVVAVKGACDFSFGLQSSGLVAFDAKTGRTRWTAPSTWYLATTVAPLSAYYQVADPVDARGIVVASDRETQSLTGLRAADGGIAWSVAGERAMGATTRAVFTSVDVGASRWPIAFRSRDRRTGKISWESSGWAEPFDIVASDDEQVVVITGAIQQQPYGPVMFVVLDARTGAEQGRFDAGNPELLYFSEAALRDGVLAYAQHVSVVGRSLPSGESAWTAKPRAVAGSVDLARSPDNKTVLALGSGIPGQVIGLDTRSGEQLWDRAGQLAAAGNSTTVLTPAPSGRTLMGLATRTGARRWRYEVAQGIAHSGVGSLQVRSAANRITISDGCDAD